VPNIPQQEPIEDSFTGVVVGHPTLSAKGLAPTQIAELDTVAEGTFVIRYGLRFLGKLHRSIVPGLLVLDYGDMLTGEEAWQFVVNKSNLYPRAEVAGHMDDGTEDIVFLKALDLAVDPQVLVYQDAQDRRPLYRISGFIGTDTNCLNPRLATYLPKYATTDEWLAAQQDME
jgi:hypothetical protein